MSSSKVDTGMFNLLEETGDKKSSKMTFEDATEKIVIPTAMPIDEETPAVTATTLPSAPPAQSFAAAAPFASDRNVVVRAPATLPGGYKFDACVDDYIVPIEVPPKGVSAGELMHVTIAENASTQKRHNIMLGRWKDGICDCCNKCDEHGIQTFCYACFCLGCSLSQVVRRLDLFKEKTLKVATCLIILQVLILSFSRDTANGIVTYVLSWCMILCIAIVRYKVRKMFAVPDMTACGACEDFICGCCCSSCVVCQLHRHVEDTPTMRGARCCYDWKGLPPGEPKEWYTRLQIENQRV